MEVNFILADEINFTCLFTDLSFHLSSFVIFTIRAFCLPSLLFIQSVDHDRYHLLSRNIKRTLNPQLNSESSFEVQSWNARRRLSQRLVWGTLPGYLPLHRANKNVERLRLVRS